MFPYCGHECRVILALVVHPASAVGLWCACRIHHTAVPVHELLVRKRRVIVDEVVTPLVVVVVVVAIVWNGNVLLLGMRQAVDTCHVTLMLHLTSDEIDLHRFHAHGDYGGQSCKEPELESSKIADVVKKLLGIRHDEPVLSITKYGKSRSIRNYIGLRANREVLVNT